MPATVVLYLLAALIGVGFLGITNSDRFLIKVIEVEGNRTITRDAITALVNVQTQQRRWFILSQNSLVWFDVDAAMARLSQQLTLNRISIQRQWPHTLAVRIEEPNPELVWVSGEQSYYLDGRGYILQPVSPQQASQLEAGNMKLLRHTAVEQQTPIIYSLQAGEVKLGTQILGSTAVERLLELTRLLPKAMTHTVAHYQYDAVDRRMIAVTQGGWQIIFSTDRPVGEQLETLKLVLTTTIKDARKLKYIDLRFGGKVYYK